MLPQLDQLSIEFKDMEIKGRVSPETALPLLNKIAVELKDLSEKKTNSFKIPEEIFEVHHLSLVTLIVLDNIKDRLKNSKIKQDNPQIALDSLTVLPILKEAVAKIQETDADETFLDLASQIQLNASQNNLFIVKRDCMTNLDETIFEVVGEISQVQQDGPA